MGIRSAVPKHLRNSILPPLWCLMDLKEHQGKAILRENGIPVLPGIVVTDADTIGEKINSLRGEELVVKAQVLTGGRGKAGGIKIVKRDNVQGAVSELIGKDIRGFLVKEVLIEEKASLLREIYVSLAVNRVEKCLSLILCMEGGVAIEELSAKSPEKIFKFPIHSSNDLSPLDSFISGSIGSLGLRPGVLQQLTDIIRKLYSVAVRYDAELVEINPLGVTERGLIALDAKFVIDDNALFRHPEFSSGKQESLTEIERAANASGIQYVELDGDIAIIGNGAGLVMATLDVLHHYGGKPANFLDVGGGASVEVMEKSLELCMMKKPKGIFINIFGGITRCDFIAQGIVDFVGRKSIGVPLVVRMIGTNEREGQKILESRGISSLSSMEDCAKKIVELVEGS